MTSTQKVFIGTDSGATTAKTGGIWEDGSIISTELRQSSTNAQLGTEAVITGWIEGVKGFLDENNLSWDRVKGVGLALPGPYLEYGVLDNSANLPDSFTGWNIHRDYSAALASAAGFALPLIVGNDGDFGGVGEAAQVREGNAFSVLLLAAGSGLGAAYINQQGLPLTGDHFAGMEGGHMPLPLHYLGEGLGDVPPFTCGCGRTWGCAEAYTTISGLTQYVAHFAPQFKGHELAEKEEVTKDDVLSLRGRAQEGDPLALKIFATQARALGIHVANLVIALDTRIVIITGGLIDPESTTEEFRESYLEGIRAAARPLLWPMQKDTIKIMPATMGELSQSIGAARMALFQASSAL